MKKRLLFLISVIVFMLPLCVRADSSVSVNVSCNSALVGGVATCTVSATPTAGLTAIEGTISMSGNAASYDSIQNGSFTSMDLTASSFSLLGNASSSVSLFTVKFKGVVAGSTTLTVRVNKISDGNYAEVPLNVTGSGKVTITAPATQEPTTQTPQTRPSGNTVSQTFTPQTTQPTTVSIVQEVNNLYLTSLTVDGFEVKEEEGIYYCTVDETTEKVIVSATAPEGIMIAGVGERDISIGKNMVTITLNDGSGGISNRSLVIIRPDGRNTNTLLESLNVVDYKIDFNPNIFEYEITVPYDTKEVYVVATAQNQDCVVTGDGFVIIDGKDSKAYVKVLYGDLTSSTYTIKFKKSYASLIPIIALSAGVAGMGIGMLILGIKLRKKKLLLANEELAEKANKERLLRSVEPQLSLNGKDTLGVGSRVVQPTVIESKVVSSRPSLDNGMVPPKQLGNDGIHPQVRVVNTNEEEDEPKVVKRVVIKHETR